MYRWESQVDLQKPEGVLPFFRAPFYALLLKPLTLGSFDAAWEVLKQWDKPLLCCFSDQDPVTKGGDKPFLAKVPGAQGQPHTTVENAHHFFQEDAAPELARIIVDAVAVGS